MRSTRAVLGLCAPLLIGASALSAQTSQPSWIIADRLAAAQAEGSVVVYSAVNESEALPVWKLFEDATGIKVQFSRGSDVALNARIAIEGRARQKTWDLAIATGVNQNPAELMAQFDPPEAVNLMPEARSTDHRWYGQSINYNAPSYNTNLVKKSELPKDWEDFASRSNWRGRVAIDSSDTQWLAGMYKHYGDDKARKLVGDLARNLEPVLVDGHLALARQIAAGEYALSLNNYINLTYSARMTGGPTEVFALEPVPEHVLEMGLSANAPHPNAALLAANFILSRPAQELSAKFGRLPTRRDVDPVPADAFAPLAGRTIVPSLFAQGDDRKWKREFDALFRGR